ncbi:MAG: hypothetical protein QOI66_3162, partial [Myxococcales bacterium]|nr:hypothetical protein [Myxococcales bacterium]
MNSKRAWPILCIFVVIASAGCAIGRKHAYDLATPHVTHQGTIWLAVAAHDQRSEVVSGQKTPTFVGLSRGGFGNPFDVNTKSGHPLATDFGMAMQRGLAARGYRITPVVASPAMRSTDVALALAKTGAPVALIAEIKEWKSDTYNNTALVYDVTVRVLDPQARVLGQAVVQGQD